MDNNKIEVYPHEWFDCSIYANIVIFANNKIESFKKIKRLYALNYVTDDDIIFDWDDINEVGYIYD